MFGSVCREIGLGSSIVSWHGSIVLRTLLRLKELVWRLDHWVGFRDCFKNRARHLLQTKPSLTTVTTTASAVCHRTQAHCTWVLSALPCHRIVRYLGRAICRPSPSRYCSHWLALAAPTWNDRCLRRFVHGHVALTTTAVPSHAMPEPLSLL